MARQGGRMLRSITALLLVACSTYASAQVDQIGFDLSGGTSFSVGENVDLTLQGSNWTGDTLEAGGVTLNFDASVLQLNSITLDATNFDYDPGLSPTDPVNPGDGDDMIDNISGTATQEFFALADDPSGGSALPFAIATWPAQPLPTRAWLSACRRFETLAITREYALRTKSYAAADERSRLATQSSNLEEYLTTLETKVEIGCNAHTQIARVAQLTQKTNQFNLTTRRYTESEIQDRVQNPAWRVFWCSCQDRFADEGVIGAALIEIKNEEWLMDTFLISCRVLGRGVEKAFLGAISDQAYRSGAKVMRGEFIRSAKNSQAENFFETCGFTAGERTVDSSKWHLGLPASADLVPKWIALQTKQYET